MCNNSRFESMPAHLGKSLVARRSNWDYTGKEEQKGDLTGTRTWAAPAGLLFIIFIFCLDNLE